MPPASDPRRPDGAGPLSTQHEYRGFVFTVAAAPEHPAYFRVDFPDFRDFRVILTGEATFQEAFAHACEALDLHLDDLQKKGLPLPRPRYRLVRQEVAEPASAP